MSRYLRWMLFAAYLAVFLAVPLYVLWDWMGLVIGLLVTATLLASLVFRAESKFYARLSLRNISKAESPELHHIVQEYCRRLGLTPPKIAFLETEALNIGILGFRKKSSTLILTQGLLENCSRAQISALIGRELCALWYGDVMLSTWLARFLNLLDPPTNSRLRSIETNRHYVYPFQVFLRQLFLLPLALFPAFILLGLRKKIDLDLNSVKLTRLPNELAESYRLLDALSQRLLFRAPFSMRHLFLVPPKPMDPLARVLFHSAELSIQTSKLSKLNHLVSLS